MNGNRTLTFGLGAAAIAAATAVLGGVLLTSQPRSGAPITPPSSAVVAPASVAAAPASPAVVADLGSPVTLRMLAADPPGRQSAAGARDFVDRVARLSNGNVTVTMTMDAGAGGFEKAVAEKVRNGDADLALAAGRVWDLEGTRSLQALQAPFLIDNDALALAVAKSDIATLALAGMTDAGVTGLALWPEDLRHLFSFEGCGRDFRTKAGIASSRIVIIPSAASRDTVAALGGLEYTGDSREADALTCAVQGMETGLVGVGLPPGDHVAVGNAVLFPKYQVLAVNSAALDHLTPAQQSVLRRAAAETQADAYTRQPVEQDLGAKWCAGGGTVVAATSSQLVALVAATQPVRSQMARDTLTRDLITAIETLKKITPASAPAAPCGQAPRESTAPPSFPVSDTTGYASTTPPRGTYRIRVTVDEVLAAGATQEIARANAGSWTLAIGAGTWTLAHRDGPRDENCSGTIDVTTGTFVRFVTTNGTDQCGFDYDIVWKATSAGLSIVLVGLPYPPHPTVQDFVDNKTVTEGVWDKVD